MTIEINPRDSGFDLLDLGTLFGNDHPVILEIGSGKGRFLLMSAAEHPERNYIGIEKSLHYHRVIHERAAKRGLTNIRLINHDAFLVLSKMLPDSSISEVHVYFPDPWPRPRERKRRMIRPEVLAQIGRVLVDGGWGIYVTDHAEYFENAAPLIARIFRSELRTPGPEDPPRTNYEAKYRQEGRPIFEAQFWK